MIEVKHLSFARGERQVLKDISLQFASGKITSLIGPTGCGKSTLLRLISGLEVPHEGEIIINGRTASLKNKIAIKPYLRQIGLVFQDLALWPHFTVYKNIAFGLQERKETNVHEKVLAILAQFSISAQIYKLPHQLSGGEKQLVAIARALILNPDILLLDEPVSNLDVRTEDMIMGYLKHVQTERQLTMICVMHDHKLAFDQSDFITVMNHGKIEASGTVDELIESDNQFLKDFIKY
jgi:ABC-type Fe3+/spermidine/putrescine transport system ATPase subunit